MAREINFRDVPKVHKWQRVLPNYTTYPYPQFRNEPLYFVQVGDVLFVRVNDQTYTFEVNKEVKHDK